MNKKDTKWEEFKKLSELELGENAAVGACIKGVSFPLLIAKQVVINKDESTGILDLVCSDLSLDSLRSEQRASLDPAVLRPNIWSLAPRRPS